MREIEFRGIDKKGVWHYGYLWESPDKNFWIKEKTDKTHNADFEVIEESIGQFTGLKDKNGKKIFEGDILKVIWQTLKEHKEDGYEDDINYYLGVIKFGYVYVGYSEEKVSCFYTDRFFPKPLGISDETTDTILEYKNTEVIGNIFENPELLEKKQ